MAAKDVKFAVDARDRMNVAPAAWPGFVANPNLNDWTTAVAAPDLKKTIQYLSDNQVRIIVKFFGNPADQKALNEAFWQFGKGTLPPDNQRPQDPKHQMNGATMMTTAIVRPQLKATSWSGACTTRLPRSSGTRARYAKAVRMKTAAGIKNEKRQPRYAAITAVQPLAIDTPILPQMPLNAIVRPRTTA